jgi:hypothetical protein
VPRALDRAIGMLAAREGRPVEEMILVLLAPKR